MPSSKCLLLYEGAFVSVIILCDQSSTHSSTVQLCLLGLLGNALLPLRVAPTIGGRVELDSLHGIAGAVVAVVGGAVLHAVVPVAYVLKMVHLQRRVSSMEQMHACLWHGSTLCW